MVLLLGAATSVGYLFRFLGFPETNEVLVYLLAVLLTAWQTDGYLYGFLATIIATFAYNFFFTAPLFTLQVSNGSYWFTFAVMTVISFITSTMTSRAKRNAQEALEKEAETEAVYNLTYRLSDARDAEEIKKIILDAIGEYLFCTAEFIEVTPGELPDLKLLKPVTTDPRNSYIRLQDGLYADEASWPILGRERVLGIIRIPRALALSMTTAQMRLLRSMLESTAIAMERLNEAEQNERTRQLAEQERYRGNLLRAISHDLRTPLSGIIGTSEMLMSMTEGTDRRHALARDIYDSADWLHAMVENILSLTRLQDGRLILDKQPEAAEEVVDAAVNHVLQQTAGREISVRTPDTLLLVPMDAKLIRQVLINLLDNAVKHTPPEGEISVTVGSDARDAVFTVLDGGSGIDEADLPHIFDMFFTTKAKPADAKHGIGLGLAICQAIVNAHGGTITARNRKDGSGAEFVFTLPLEAYHE
jgi:two-component system sensor histidine kinase KdpD